MSPEEKKHLTNVDYAGKQLDNDFAFDLALGNVDLTCGKKNDSWVPHEKPMTLSNDDNNVDVNCGNGNKQFSMWSKSLRTKTENPFEMKYGHEISESIDDSSMRADRKAEKEKEKEKKESENSLLINEMLNEQEIKLKRVLSSGSLFQPKKKMEGITESESVSNFTAKQNYASATLILC